MTHNVKWQVSLSNGQTFIEDKSPFEEIEGELSPFLRLDKYITEHKLEITSLSLITQDGRTFNLPSMGNNPKFRFFKELDKPIEFWIQRVVSRETSIVNNKAIETKNTSLFTVASAIYPTYELQIWVDENNSKNSWSLVKAVKK